jgi:thiosulfate dehydrogenase [quinone] large subunit
MLLRGGAAGGPHAGRIMAGTRASRHRPPADRRAAGRDTVGRRFPRRLPLVDTATSWDWFRPPPHSLSSAGWVILPLRMFLGFTFCFAGLQKLANPRFLAASNPASIQSQLTGAARTSPIHSLIAPLVHVAVTLGLLIAVAELAIGLGTIFGLWTRVAAVGGIALSLGLFLTISFHSSPYYTGSDIVFLFAWTPLLLAGSGGVLSVDALVPALIRTQLGAEPAAIVPIPFAAVRRVCGSYATGSCQARDGAPCAPGPCPYLVQRPTPERRLDVHEIDRRTFASKGAVATGVAIAGLFGGGMVAAIGRLLGGSSPTSGAALTGGSGAPATSAPPTTTARHPGSTPTTVASPPRPPGTAIGAADQVPVGGAASFTDPTSGDPSLVVRPQAGTFLAFDAVCPHAGCTVQFDGTNKVFVCPCHGSEFNAHTGAVEVGPAATGLTQLRIAEGSDGQLYVT